MRRFQVPILLTALILLLAPVALPQTALPWGMRLQQGQTVSDLADGGSITLAADALNRATSVSLTITYRGTSTGYISAVQYSGSLDFTTSPPPDPSSGFTQGQIFSINIQYLPTISQRQTGRIVFNYTEGTGTRLSQFAVNLIGLAPEFAFSYTPQGGNATLLSSGGTIALPAVAIGSTSSATVTAINRGSSRGLVNSVSATGQGFQVAGAPLPGTGVEAGNTLSFQVTCTPAQLDPVTGGLQIELIDRTVSFNVTASGLGASYAYEVVSGSTVAALLPGQAIVMPDTAVGSPSSITVRVRNTGNYQGTISVSILGSAFTVDASFQPLTLLAGASATATVTFTPTQPGPATGHLRIGNDVFDLSGNGLGPLLSYYFVSGGTSTQVQNNGSVIFAPVAVGGASSVQFQIANTGTQSTSFTSITLSGAGTPPIFTLASLPGSPFTVAAGAAVSFTVTFKPTASGAATATLKIDNLAFTLSASANPPVALPGYSFQAPSAPIDALQQPAVGLTLASAYPLALAGTLTMTFNSEVFSNDPSVQFAVGSRTVTFNIPAGQTQAVFPNNSTQIKLQTGTVAGTITITPAFATTDSGLNLTPANPLSLNMVVAQSAPRLTGLLISAKGTSTFTLQISGYATGRSITQIDLTFTATAGENVGTTKISLAAEPTFLAWYQSATSQQYGSQFTASIPLTMQGDVKNVTNVVDTIQSVTVTLTNRLGTSAAQSVNLK